MMTETASKWRTKYAMVFAIPVFIVSLMAFTNGKEISTPVNSIVQGPGDPNGWFKAGSSYSDYTVGIDTQVSQNGQKSAFIESVVDGPTGFSTLMQNCNVKDFKGKRIRMSGYIKSQGNSTSMMWLRIDDFGNRMTGDFDNMGDRPINGDSDWTKCEIVFDVPDSECMMNFGVILSGAGKLWFDNISFEVVGNEIGKTAWNMNEELPQEGIRRMLEQYPDGLPEKLPVNLDFEE